MDQSLMDRYAGQIAGTLSCYDRVVVTGTLPHACYPEGMTHYLHNQGIPIFEYPSFAEGLRDQVRKRAAELTAEAGISIEYISHRGIRKEEVVARVLRQRGEHPGLVHVLSAIEGCTCYRPRRDEATGLVSVKRRKGKCLHYYFYFMDPVFGLVHLRVPTPAFAGAGSGRRSACSSASTATAGWRANSQPPASATPCWTTHSPGSTTGAVHNNWPTACPRMICTKPWITMRRCAARSARRSTRAITGA